LVLAGFTEVFMGLGKQAKTLTSAQANAVLAFVATTRHPLRNRLIFLLSVRAGLRAKEIAGLTWVMVTDSEGSVALDIALRNQASKGKSGRIIPMSKELRSALVAWKAHREPVHPAQRVIATERSEATSSQVIVNLFRSWYARLGFQGCSSHSGRRTFITNAARRISTVGGSLRDVQSLAGHSSLATTQRYIEINADAKRKVVELLG
jgi:integrase/recombinase XerD